MSSCYDKDRNTITDIEEFYKCRSITANQCHSCPGAGRSGESFIRIFSNTSTQTVYICSAYDQLTQELIDSDGSYYMQAYSIACPSGGIYDGTKTINDCYLPVGTYTDESGTFDIAYDNGTTSCFYSSI